VVGVARAALLARGRAPNAAEDWTLCFVAHADGARGRYEAARSPAWVDAADGDVQGRDAAWRALCAELQAKGWEPDPSDPAQLCRRFLRW
jgi:hypothetical protein